MERKKTADQTPNNDKKQALDTAIRQIEKNFGKGAVMRLGQNQAMQVEAISTGSLSLDLALGIGGLPRGRIVEIYGPESSGKTTLALRLKERFGEDEVRLISHDSYYKRHDELPFEERCKLNYDHPDAFDNALLIYHLQELKAGRAIDCPVYDYADHNRSNEVQHIEPAPVLIVEGILPFVEPELCAMFDYKIFVDTDADERILRRLVRDVKERGRSLDSVIEQYLTTVKPMHEAFVEPSKRNADIIVPNGGENTTAIEMLAHHIRSLIEKANML